MTLKTKIIFLFLAIIYSYGALDYNFIEVDNPNNNDILFEFYSSSEKAVKLAYINKLDESWKFVEMIKDGNKFSTKLKIDKNVWYEFVTSPNIWFKKDPLNSNIKNDHPFISNVSPKKTQNRNIETKYAFSEHFDFFTTKDTADIKTLEFIYDRLTKQTLNFLDNNLHPANNKKIRYYSSIYKGMYCISGSGEIIDDVNILNSHEIIHALLYKYPKFPPFAEGIAQCFQERGNKLPLVEPNCNLAAKKIVSRVDLYNVLSDWNNNTNYHIVGSFIYYNLFINLEKRPKFITLIKSLTDPNLTFENFENLYKQIMRKNLKTSIEQWKQWVVKIDYKSNIYVNWN